MDGEVCVSVRVHMFACAWISVCISLLAERTWACLRAVRAVRATRSRKRSPLQSSSEMPWKRGLCLAAMLFFPLIIVNVHLILPALNWLLARGSSSADRKRRRRGSRRSRRRWKRRGVGARSLLLNPDPGAIVPPNWLGLNISSVRYRQPDQRKTPSINLLACSLD